MIFYDYLNPKDDMIIFFKRINFENSKDVFIYNLERIYTCTILKVKLNVVYKPLNIIYIKL